VYVCVCERERETAERLDRDRENTIQSTHMGIYTCDELV